MRFVLNMSVPRQGSKNKYAGVDATVHTSITIFRFIFPSRTCVDRSFRMLRLFRIVVEGRKGGPVLNVRFCRLVNRSRCIVFGWPMKSVHSNGFKSLPPLHQCPTLGAVVTKKGRYTQRLCLAKSTGQHFFGCSKFERTVYSVLKKYSSQMS